MNITGIFVYFLYAVAIGLAIFALLKFDGYHRQKDSLSKVKHKSRLTELMTGKIICLCVSGIWIVIEAVEVYSYSKQLDEINLYADVKGSEYITEYLTKDTMKNLLFHRITLIIWVMIFVFSFIGFYTEKFAYLTERGLFRGGKCYPPKSLYYTFVENSKGERRLELYKLKGKIPMTFKLPKREDKLTKLLRKTYISKAEWEISEFSKSKKEEKETENENS